MTERASQRPGGLRLERALAAIPDLDSLRPLRETAVEVSREDVTHAWSAAAGLSILDKRLLDPDALEERIEALAESTRRRTERVMRSVAAALRALETGDHAEAAARLIEAGEVEEAEGRLAEAAAFYEKSVELGRRARDRGSQSRALRRLGTVVRARGDLDRARRAFREGFEVAEAEGDRPGAMIGAMGVGHVLSDQGRWGEAREWYGTAAARAVDRAAPEFVHLCNALSVVERRLGDLQESERWLLEGERALERSDDAGARAFLEHGRARLHFARREPDAAAAIFRRAVDRSVDPRTRAVILVNLAEALIALGDLDEAERVARQAEAVAIGRGALALLVHVYVLLGEIAGARSDGDGFLFFEQALDLVQEHHLPPADEAAVQRAYGRFEARMGDADPARARLRMALEIYRGIGAVADAEEVGRELEELDELDGPTTQRDRRSDNEDR